MSGHRERDPDRAGLFVVIVLIVIAAVIIAILALGMLLGIPVDWGRSSPVAWGRKGFAESTLTCSTHGSGDGRALESWRAGGPPS